MSRSSRSKSFRGNKSHLPSKDCATCGLPFAWRKKWERNWDEVKYCSERCRREKKSEKKSETKNAG